MFGYVRAIPDVLPEEEARRYETVYCGLCAALGARYGWTARFILNYDFVFLVMLLAPGETGDCVCRTCPARPWRRKPCRTGGAALDAAADESIILTWWKLKDTLRDGRWWEKLAARTAMVFLKKHYRTAASRRPDFDRTVAGCLEAVPVPLTKVGVSMKSRKWITLTTIENMLNGSVRLPLMPIG